MNRFSKKESEFLHEYVSSIIDGSIRSSISLNQASKKTFVDLVNLPKEELMTRAKRFYNQNKD